MAYLHGYLSIFLRYGDHAAACRSGQLHRVIARKKKAARAAVKGKK